MDHSELVAELPVIEKLTPAERIQLARERRAMQLLKCREREAAAAPPAARIERVRFGTEIALLEATARGDPAEVERLLTAEGANPNSHNEDGLTPLHQCAIDNNHVVLLLLLDNAADVNAQDTEQWTPLHAAACCAHMDIVRHLIDRGANLLAVNADGNMPYDICDDDATLDLIESEMARRGFTQEDVDGERGRAEQLMLDDLKQLHQYSQPLDMRADDNSTPLHVAAANGYYDVAAFLLRCGVSPGVRDNDSWQPIHAAACWAQPDLVEILAEYGADVNAKTSTGETAMDLCEDEHTRAIIASLQAEAARRRRMAFGARDSRRQSRKKKAFSKFESPQPQVSPLSDSPFSARGAIRRLSLRDRSGMTLARLEAQKEQTDLMRSWSIDNPPEKVVAETRKKKGEKKTKDSDTADASEDAAATSAEATGVPNESPKKRAKNARMAAGGAAASKAMSPDEWLLKLEQEERADEKPSTEARGRRGRKPKAPSPGRNGAVSGGGASTTSDGADDSCSVTTDAPRRRFSAPKGTVVGAAAQQRTKPRCCRCCVIS